MNSLSSLWFHAPARRAITVLGALLFALCLLFVLTGCSTVPQTIEAASTTYTATQPDGTKVSVSFPKELSAKGFEVIMGGATIKATEIQSSSSHVIDSAGSATAAANAEMARMLSAFSGTFDKLLAAILANNLRAPATIETPAPALTPAPSPEPEPLPPTPKITLTPTPEPSAF